MPLSPIRTWRRRRMLMKPFPDSWKKILTEKFPFYSLLDNREKELFHRHLTVFLNEKHWEGARGLQVTEKMKVIISASAARISRKLPLSVYDRLTEIVIYPSHYLHSDNEESIIFGQAHHFGTVVLSWDAVQQGIAIPDDARDTTIHEFAHVLDIASGAFNGTPLLERGRDYKSWIYVMSRHFTRLRDNPVGGCLRAYGAENEAEFFAVATEAFFETPEQLKNCAPDLYEVLSHFFKLDPR